MRIEIHPAARRITWLIIVSGGLAALIAIYFLVFNPGPGISLPITRTALDAGWLLILGLAWFVIGLLMLRWLRPTGSIVAPADEKTRQLADLDTLNTLDARIRSLETQISATETRLSSLERTLQIVQPRGKTANPQRDLDNELGSLATAIRDLHTRLDDLGDVNHRLHDLESQLDQMYVTLQDAHRRLDEIEHMRQ